MIKSLTLVAFSGKVVVDYVPLIEKAIDPNQLWLAAYCDDVLGYLLSARVLAEGDYETRGVYSGGAGFFDPRAEKTLVQAVPALAQKAGRWVSPLPRFRGRGAFANNFLVDGP